MTLLTTEQHQAVEQAGGAPVNLVDPVTNTTYVLLRTDEFEAIRARAEGDDFDPREAYPFVDEVMAEDDAADPSLESYQSLGGSGS